MNTPTLTEAIAIARATDRQLHASGYSNVTDARERAAEVLADEVERQAERLQRIASAMTEVSQ